jgi:hypothetical protein
LEMRFATFRAPTVDQGMTVKHDSQGNAAGPEVAVFLRRTLDFCPFPGGGRGLGSRPS